MLMEYKHADPWKSKFCHVRLDNNENLDSIICSIPFNNYVTENLLSKVHILINVMILSW